MRLAAILTIFRKDIRDAIRDARVLMAIIVPFGMGVLYNVITDDQEPLPEVTIVWAGDTTSQLPNRLLESTRDAVDVTIVRATDDASVRERVANEDASVGIIIPDGFDKGIHNGEQPRITAVLAESPSVGANYIAAELTPVVRDMAGQADPATVEVQRVVESGSSDIIARLGPRTYFVLASATTLIGMVALLAVPVVLADEADKHTLDALVMVVSYADVVTAKALFGVAYIVAGVPLLLMVTGIVPKSMLLFAGGMAAFSLALIGFGLLLGGLFSAAQLNTWGGLLLIPILFPAFSTGLPTPRALEIVALLLPTSHATRIAVNGISGEAVFNYLGLSFLVLALWAAAGYGLLLWRLSRREA